MRRKKARGGFRLAVLAAGLLCVLSGAPVHAQQATPAPPSASGTGQQPNDAVATTRDPFISETATALDSYGDALSSISEAVGGEGGSDDALARLQVQVDQLQSELSKTDGAIQARLGDVRAQLAELGSAPGPGESPEPDVTTQERNTLLAERSELNALADRLSKLGSSAEETSDRVSEIRREQFARALFKHTDLQELFSTDFGTLWHQQFDAFRASYGGWLSFIWQSKRIQFIIANLLSILAAAFAYRLSTRFVERTKLDLQMEEPDYVIRLLAAFWTTMIPCLALFAFLTVSYVLFVGMGIFLPDVERFVLQAYVSGAIIFFVFLLSRNVLTPGRPQWRLMPIGNAASRNLMLAFTAMALINWGDILIGVLNETLDAGVQIDVLRSLISSVLIGAILVAVSFIRPRPPVEAEKKRTRTIALLFPSAIAFSARMVGLFVMLCALVGYVALARFAAKQVVLTGAVLITMYIGMLVGQAVSQAGSIARTSFGKRFVERFQLSAVRADQLSLLAGLFIYALTLFIGIPLVLLSWGVRYEQMRLWAANNLTSVTIGSITISLGGILVGVLLFVGGFLATRWFQGWFDNNVLLRSRADAGVRNSVKTGISYLGIVLASLLAISAAGVNLSSLALVASALSIGIGFGLQTIVSNFVSGLILLAERPFKVGDWIVSGTTEGFVKRISVRATEIETFQRQSIIVPNSELINASVGNWMHHNQMGRSEVAVGVSYDSDPRKVMDILMDIGTSHPLVLQNPEPMVIFMGFGESTLDFEVRVYLADVFNGISVRNDIRVAIFERFKEEGITIPYPQRDLHIIPQKERRDELADAIRKHTRKNAPAEPVAPAHEARPMFDHPDAGNDDGGER
ncbi:mechanosensitive ion channel domain-containing protein [Martelella sp. AD-3]|uniref:mechanosensitive ion channel domain-containing protein n=1 Tax=Martelella sp. AD-3 TaxID=686597 RepID=UPI0004BB6D53|nr:mechanosensitive ion channel domain-containing protein [Martelella sp. AD-3]MAM09226.1 mechanosensitive ion channel protein [Rhizobiaceae bacterium]